MNWPWPNGVIRFTNAKRLSKNIREAFGRFGTAPVFRRRLPNLAARQVRRAEEDRLTPAAPPRDTKNSPLCGFGTRRTRGSRTWSDSFR